MHESKLRRPKLAGTVRVLSVVDCKCTTLTAHEHGTHISTMAWQALG